MLEKSLNILKKIEQKGFKAYIVGGFVRDYLLNKNSSDVDIATNATPKDIKNIFSNSFIPNEAYGSITVIFENVRFEITTFREELSYINNRKPFEIRYIDSLIDDLKRRDFTINTFCMDSNGNILDILNAKEDLDNNIIKTVDDSINSFTQDTFRILRAIRFATVLNFSLDENLKKAIDLCKHYLINISYNRKKSELDKIFMSKNACYGIKLLIELGLDKELEIYNLKDIKLSNDLLGVWSSLNVSSKYPFTKSEKELIDNIKKLTSQGVISKYDLYKYGPYISSVAATNMELDKAKIISDYNDLPIKSSSDILISSAEIIDIFNKKPGRYISEVYFELENKIISGELNNDNSSIREYLLAKRIGA